MPSVSILRAAPRAPRILGPAWRRPGFTLVELLVVVAIIIVLAALAFVVLSSTRKKADSALETAHMREIGIHLLGYASSHHNRLPPARADIAEENGDWGQLHWFEALLAEARPELEPETWRDEEWWLQNEPVFLNRKINEESTPNAFAWWNPGYAINRQIVTNIDPDGIGWNWNPGKNGPQTYAIPLNFITEPGRTPIIAPRADWHFTYAGKELNEPGLEQFLTEGKMPILFIDGHVERMPLSEYEARKLHEMPAKR